MLDKPTAAIPAAVQTQMAITQQDAQTAAQTIINRRETTNDALDRIRHIRLTGKTAINALSNESTEADFEALFEQYKMQLDDIKSSL